jgi:hypothetical protein
LSDRTSIFFFLHLYTLFVKWCDFKIQKLQSAEVFFICKCKTNTIPILMHQMRMSTNQVSSVVLRPKKVEIRKIVNAAKEPKKPNTVLWNIEPNLSKDRAMHEGDNPSFWDKFIKSTFFLTELFIFLSKYRST